VFFAAVSPVTLALAAGAVVALVVLGVPLWLALPTAVVVWVARVLLARRLAAGRARRPARIDPFALREPWRFYVRDALQARARFGEAQGRAADGPLRERLGEIGRSLDEAVERCWAVARRGQELADAARALDRRRIERELAALPPESADPSILAAADLAEQAAADEAGGLLPAGDPVRARRASLRSQLESAIRLQAQADATRHRLEVIDAQLGEAVARSVELATRTGNLESVQGLAEDVDRVVVELEALRLGLDEAGGDPGTT
jgi:hypothetical protein